MSLFPRDHRGNHLLHSLSTSIGRRSLLRQRGMALSTSTTIRVSPYASLHTSYSPLDLSCSSQEHHDTSLRTFQAVLAPPRSPTLEHEDERQRRSNEIAEAMKWLSIHPVEK